ncbi:hypothetical protein MMC12_006874 [Toensbergia leucococca]|nr:hypothetical protein [Toensbergia leucococca]
MSEPAKFDGSPNPKARRLSDHRGLYRASYDYFGAASDDPDWTPSSTPRESGHQFLFGGKPDTGRSRCWSRPSAQKEVERKMGQDMRGAWVRPSHRRQSTSNHHNYSRSQGLPQVPTPPLSRAEAGREAEPVGEEGEHDSEESQAEAGQGASEGDPSESVRSVSVRDFADANTIEGRGEGGRARGVSRGGSMQRDKRRAFGDRRSAAFGYC